MARKKFRPAKPAAVPATAVQAAPPAAAPRTDVIKPGLVNRAAAPASEPAKSPAHKPVERAWIEVVGIRATRALGSLQLAVPLLILFALAVLLGTLMESSYTQKIAQELVYRSWWFILLLLLLSVCIFCAAAKKWPWKRHQTGFVITHVGLLTMLAGGILNGMLGTDATMALVDTSDVGLQHQLRNKYGTVHQVSSHYAYNDIYEVVTVSKTVGHDADGRPSAKSSKPRQEDFEGGPLPWHAGTKLRVGRDPWLVILTALQSPFGRGWSRELDGGDQLEAINYLPSARHVPFSPAGADEKQRPYPAFKVTLRSGRQPVPLDEWLAFNIEEQWPEMRLPVLPEFLGTCPEALLPEFLAPPAAKELGPKGILVVRVGGQNYRLSVEDALKRGGWAEVGKTGMQVKINKYVPNFGQQAAADAPAFPLVEFEWKQGGEEGEYKIMARFTGVVLDVKKHGAVEQKDGAPRLFWYHPPDMRWGDENLRGVLDFVQAAEGVLYYREFANREQDGKAEFVRASSGRAELGQEYPVFDKMKFRFRVGDYLAKAVKRDRYVPIDAIPGKEKMEDKMQATPAIHFRLTGNNGKQSQEFWVGLGRRAEPVQVGNRQYDIRFTQKAKPLGFELKLERAEQTVDPGTRAAATFTSFVEVSDPARGVKGKKEEITMNKPLEYGGFTFYQSTYERTEYNDASGRPVSLSGFTVSNDPGIALKYLGSIFLSLGIACMFYMKAYFFKPHKRPALAAASGPASPDGPTKENDE